MKKQKLGIYGVRVSENGGGHTERMDEWNGMGDDKETFADS